MPSRPLPVGRLPDQKPKKEGKVTPPKTASPEASQPSKWYCPKPSPPKEDSPKLPPSGQSIPDPPPKPKRKEQPPMEEMYGNVQSVVNGQANRPPSKGMSHSFERSEVLLERPPKPQNRTFSNGNEDQLDSLPGNRVKDMILRLQSKNENGQSENPLHPRKASTPM